jgi:hypothetical protein
MCSRFKVGKVRGLKVGKVRGLAYDRHIRDAVPVFKAMMRPLLNPNST